LIFPEVGPCGSAAFSETIPEFLVGFIISPLYDVGSFSLSFSVSFLMSLNS